MHDGCTFSIHAQHIFEDIWISFTTEDLYHTDLCGILLKSSKSTSTNNKDNIVTTVSMRVCSDDDDENIVV